MYLTYVLGVVVSAAALGGPDAVAATGLPVAWDAAQSLALGTEEQPGSSESDTPFDEAEQTSDPSESSRGEERPEADGEKVFVDGRGFPTPAFPDILAEPVRSLRPAHEVSLESQFHPDGLERPPRA